MNLAPTGHEHVIVVNENNRKIAVAEKSLAHRQGLLHRAFSIFLIDGDARVVLQQRHLAKYHSGGLWANTCCGHPRPGERTLAAAQRRLQEELGVTANLRLAFRTRYRMAVSPEMTENELVYVYFGALDGKPSPNPVEIDALKAMSLVDLERDARHRPERWAVWLRHYMDNHQTDLRDAVNAHTARLAAA
jgi:isopentenyl-diphosphate delta-isomerase